MAWCKGCGKKIDWFRTAANDKPIPLDPDPHPEGNLTFDPQLRVIVAAAGSKPKMYRSHFVTCEKASDFRKAKPKAFICERAGCDIEGVHRHCFECGSTEHLAEDCPDGG